MALKVKDDKKSSLKINGLSGTLQRVWRWVLQAFALLDPQGVGSVARHAPVASG